MGGGGDDEGDKERDLEEEKLRQEAIKVRYKELCVSMMKLGPT